MWVFRDNEPDYEKDALTFALGAVGGLAVGLLLSRRSRPARAGGLGSDLRQRVGRAAAHLRPERRTRITGDETELTALEDAVLDAFLADSTLRERGIDVGALSRGIIELSGSVWTEGEADLAVRVANGVDGVQTVVNRMEIEEEVSHADRTRRRLEDGDPALNGSNWEGRRVGMGRRRQGRETDPPRPDDSQHQEERALENADRDQWQEEELAAVHPRTSDRPEDERPGQATEFDHDDLDNQDPHRRHHSRATADSQPQALNTSSRVGEGLKPGTELSLEQADVPVKPHGGNHSERRSRDDGDST